jgi:hypothetical protein
MQRVAGTSIWNASIPGARRGVDVCYYLLAFDFLDNSNSSGSEASPICFTSENHPPQLTILSPQEGDSVGNQTTVRWQVSDLDGDPVTVSLSYRRVGDVDLIPVPLTTEEQGLRTKVLDTSGFPAGQYQLRLDATDDQAVHNRTTAVVNITVGAGGGSTEPGAVGVDRTLVNPGEAVTVRIEIPRPASDVEARLLKDGNVVEREPMDQVPAGSRFWEATLHPKDPGVYQVEVAGTYDDGTPFTIKGASSITVGGGLGAAADVAVIGALAAGVVVLGVAGLRRRGLL